MSLIDQLSDAATRLYQYILRNHWNTNAIEGPDPGIRLNARIGRFVKNYLRVWPWSDNLVYVQAQGYWIMNNWLIHDLDLADKVQCRQIALACADYLTDIQRPEGYWEYPNPEWKGRIATVEGNYAALGLLASYSRANNEKFLSAAIRWHDFAVTEIGFQGENGHKAINYFYGPKNGSLVPNVSVSFLRVLATLAHATGDGRYLESAEDIIRWLCRVQLPSGELPYAVAAPGKGPNFDRIHFLCFQYNAFEFLNLAHYYHLTKDKTVMPILAKLAEFVAGGLTSPGPVRYDCHRERPEIPYYTMAAGAALSHATRLGLHNYDNLVPRVIQSVLSQLKPNGEMVYYSRGNYGFLSDRRSYPRYLAMILQHLLLEIDALKNTSRKAAAH